MVGRTFRHGGWRRPGSGAGDRDSEQLDGSEMFCGGNFLPVRPGHNFEWGCPAIAFSEPVG